MVNRRPSDAADLATPAAPLAKRKRRASCLGEQERRERKRAIDREAQRSLREKTKTHIAELERTIQILRDQDRNGATANLLSEIDGLRAENERLRDIIDSVKSVLGNDIAPRTTAVQDPPTTHGAGAIASPASSSNGHRSPKSRTVSFVDDCKPSLPTPTDLPTSYEFSERRESTRAVDLDGMNIVSNMHACPNLQTDLDLEPVEEVPTTEIITEIRRTDEDIQDWENNPATASWGPLMQEFFGDSWRCPSPTILHIGAPNSSNPPSIITVCPIWKKSNELFEKVYNSCSTGTKSLTLYKKKLSTPTEAGLLFLGIKEDWVNMPDTWMQSPALVILKQVDQFLFCHLPRMERLATAYKSFKLLKYYLNSNAEQLKQVPKWLRPGVTQASTAHPIAVDFFAWPTLRNRLVSQHTSIFQTSALSHVYSRYLQFDWPFAFEDAFFHDEATGQHYPSPLFERYHGDLRNWSVKEEFYEKFPEMRSDIEGDRRQFGESIAV